MEVHDAALFYPQSQLLMYTNRSIYLYDTTLTPISPLENVHSKSGVGAGLEEAVRSDAVQVWEVIASEASTITMCSITLYVEMTGWKIMWKAIYTHLKQKH